jgi:RHS repeat-associated protein
MTENHQLLYPPKENDTSVVHRRYDAMERLVAWTARQEDHVLVFRVVSFREESLENGKTVQVPERIECRFAQMEVAPEGAFAGTVADTTLRADDSSMQAVYTWTGRELDVDSDLRYNQTRYFDPTPGRWITDDPLGFEEGTENLHPYPLRAEKSEAHQQHG